MSMTGVSPQLSTSATNFSWLMTSFVDNTAGAEQAIVVSSDGVLMAVANLDRLSADRVSAIVTGVRSLSDGAAGLLNRGPLHRVIVEMRTGYLLVTAVGGGSVLGVVCSKQCDLGLVSYEMSLLVQRVGQQLTPELITELTNSMRVP
jgi:uncharacterized protein